MKRPLQLSLAIALALSGTDALALGLGTIHVNSKLNQPLDAEIPVLTGTQGEAEGLAVQLAAAEDFDRVGLNRSRLSVPLEFSVVKGSRGDLVIKVTSKEVIREPFLDFLVEANWPKGRLLREYTVLLDPPVMAPATGSTAVAAAPKAPAPTPSQPEPPKPKAAPAPAKSPPAVAAAPRPEPAPAKPAPISSPKHAAASGEYTVEAGDTLSAIARETKPDDATNINQMMLALLKQNPNAFYKDNINALKRGAILRIPSADQIRAVGSASEAAATVHSQIEDWRGGAASKPTLVADTGTAPEPGKAPAKAAAGTSTSGSSGGAKANEHLALVPPKAGKDSASADRPGSGASGSASGSSNAEIKAELARTKEALASREQEAGELKSRVKDLEDTKSKTDRLISLKDSEIADLQQKLKDLQSGKTTAKTAATTPASTTPPATSTTTAPATGAAATAGKTEAGKVSKEDIWGTASTSGENKSATPPTASTGTTPPGTTPPATSTPPTGASTTTPSTSAPASSPSTPSATGTSATTATSPPTTTPSTAPTTPSSTPPSTTGDSTTASTTTPAATTPEPPKTTATPPPPAKPAATTSALKPTATTKPAPIASAWYEQSWVKPAAIGAGALLLLAGLLGLRKRKAEPAVERGSIAGAFGDSPIREGGGGMTFAAEEQSLRDQLENDPANLGLHLELLSLLYSERNAPAFEEAAAAMHPYVVDAHQPEWLEAKAMGQELAPHNPLFAEGPLPAADEDLFDDEAVTASHATPTFDHDDVFAFDNGPERRHEESAFDTPIPASTSAFDFDLGAPPPPSEPAQPAMPPPGESAFAFDSLPPIDFAAEAHREIEPMLEPEPAPLPVDEDEFAGDDAVGTKLDLAKAYLDMGDPEGARSMLEEVLAEGNDSQKGEARKLMAEIR